jgi:hypothetical protein
VEKISRGAPQRFADEVNAYFQEEGVGWKLDDGLIVARGSLLHETHTHLMTQFPPIEAGATCSRDDP